jgi:hypothetical protein
VSKSKAVGITVLVIDQGDNKRSISSDLKILKERTLAGRHCAVVYDLPSLINSSHLHVWGKKSTCYEALLVESFLGLPTKRGGNNEWEFFANLAIRLCVPQKRKRRIAGEVAVLIFRKSGPKPYKRRSEASSDLLESAEIDALHSVFTRDVANNIWHMKNLKSRNQIADRLGTLLAWPDEQVLVSRGSKIKGRSRQPSKYDQDLIGVPNKVPYDVTSF